MKLRRSIGTSQDGAPRTGLELRVRVLEANRKRLKMGVPQKGGSFVLQTSVCKRDLKEDTYVSREPLKGILSHTQASEHTCDMPLPGATGEPCVGQGQKTGPELLESGPGELLQGPALLESGPGGLLQGPELLESGPGELLQGPGKLEGPRSRSLEELEAVQRG